MRRRGEGIVKTKRRREKEERMEVKDREGEEDAKRGYITS